jgi:hypothetical protein
LNALSAFPSPKAKTCSLPPHGTHANTAVFSAVNAALFRPTYAERPAELVSFFNGGRDRQGTSNHSYPAYVDLRDGTAAILSGLAAYTTRPVNMIVGHKVERINVGLVCHEMGAGHWQRRWFGSILISSCSTTFR